MGGRSNSKGGGVQDDSAKQMAANGKHKVSNDTMMGMIEDLQGGQLSNIVPLFGAMVGNGLQMFNQNPNMPSPMDLGMFEGFFQPQQQQQQPQPQQPMPQQPQPQQGPHGPSQMHEPQMYGLPKRDRRGFFGGGMH